MTSSHHRNSVGGLWLSFMMVLTVLLGTGAGRVLAVTAELETRKLDASQNWNPSADDFLFRMTSAQHFWVQPGMQRSTEEGKRFEDLAKKEPAKYKAKLPLKDVARLGDLVFPFVMDGANVKSKGYDTLYFDLNRNGDLTDDKVIKAQATPDGMSWGGNSAQRAFPRIDLQLEADGEKYDHGLLFSVYSNYDSDTQYYVSAEVKAGTYREGKITIDGKEHRIAVLDYNGTGRFNDLVSVDTHNRGPDGIFYPNTGDIVLVDPEKTSEGTYWGWGPVDLDSRHLLSKLIAIDGKFYEIKIPASGGKVTIEPSKLALGAVSNPNGPYRAVVFSDDSGAVKINAKGDEPVPVPAGEWRLLEYKIDWTKGRGSETKPAEKTDKDAEPKKEEKSEEPKPVAKKSLAQRLAAILGADEDSGSSPSIEIRRPTFTFVSARATNEVKPIKVQANKTTPLPFGPPYTPKVRVAWVGDEGKEAQLELAVAGSAGESCSDLMVKGDRPSAPTLKILDKKGELVKKGKFEFG